ncbi:sufE-like protein 2, chloroplastic isoform X2 [Andrographis paniculata]|uniref:sufE-like protein 2, chloroplastic isoform X2 n=1 Tax=Andrographis paniculata TaxID=175694 RepID=UPI0021E7FDC3|nr:sufE-like protein 2, chloroplastic isoform X2 [Andrographis paniculata]
MISSSSSTPPLPSKMATFFLAGSSASLSPSPLLRTRPNLNSSSIASKHPPPPPPPPPCLIPSNNPASRRKSRMITCAATNNQQQQQQPLSVSEKVQRLGIEFKSLAEPIDRVRRLLHYASLLPALDEASRAGENRVPGCTAQVWLDVKIDAEGVVMLRADSDSEITKGFCSCLIWVLDGAAAEEVLSVKADDFVEMNVGLPSPPTRGRGRGNSSSSRVNTWHNVLMSMQKRTGELLLAAAAAAAASATAGGGGRRRRRRNPATCKETTQLSLPSTSTLE